MGRTTKARRKQAAGGDPLWFKDAVIYEVHVRAFFDGNGDGCGDFAGLTQKLDYIQDLGVNTIWLLPFYTSPTTTTSIRPTARGRSSAPSYGKLTGATCGSSPSW
jgi:maltose alpha-D-glucosyltransferase / alpha-amylase